MNNKLIAKIIVLCSFLLVSPVILSMDFGENESMNDSSERYMADEDNDVDMSDEDWNDEDWNDEDWNDEDWNDEDWNEEDYNYDEDEDWNDEDWSTGYEEEESPEQNLIVETEEMKPQGEVNEDDDIM